MTQPLRIAVAEDEPDMLEYYRRTLIRLGHRIVCAANDGESLVEYCRNQAVDLVISDIRLPGIDGRTVAREVAAMKSVPVILISAFDPPPTAQPELADAPIVHLVKPIKKADLVSAISRARQRSGVVSAEPQDHRLAGL